MNAKYYAVPGNSEYTAAFSATYTPTDDEILMQGERPTAEHIAQADGTWALPVPTLDDVVASFDTLIDERLESFARQFYSKGYANAVTYKESSVPAWKLEAEYLIQARDNTWLTAYNLLNNVLPLVMEGKRGIPTWEEIEVQLPVLAWPEGSRGYASE